MRTLPKDSRIFVAGRRGLVGSAVWRGLEKAGYANLVGPTSQDLDLRDRAATFDALADLQPDVVIDAAARVGGIVANATEPVEFLSDNLQIQTNLLDAAHHSNVDRFLFLGSSCIYPRMASQPISEDSLLTGPLEETNIAYAIAKISGVIAVQSYRKQYGRNWISAMPTNLYGPGDNFDLRSSHVLPALIRRFHEAKSTGAPSVTLWGTGEPLREFLHVDDLAAATLVLLENYDADEPINVGTGTDLHIRELAEIVRDVVGYHGQIEWDATRPDGTPRKLLDVSRIRGLGWEPSIELAAGIADTYAWYLQHIAPVG